jgi:hypothetical protein
VKTISFRDRLAEIDPEILLADGFEDAFLGVGWRCAQVPIAVYDRDMCVEVLMKRDGMSYEDAEEFFDFNVMGAWVGERTPMFVHTLAGGDK